LGLRNGFANKNRARNGEEAGSSRQTSPALSQIMMAKGYKKEASWGVTRSTFQNMGGGGVTKQGRNTSS